MTSARLLREVFAIHECVFHVFFNELEEELSRKTQENLFNKQPEWSGNIMFLVWFLEKS